MTDWSGAGLASFAANHLWQSSLCVAVAAVAAWLCRGGRASLRHGIWVAASAKFLVPFSALAALAAPVNVWSRVALPPARGAVTITLDIAAQPFTPPRVARASSPLHMTPAGLDDWWLPVVLVLWLAGTCAYLLRWRWQWRRVSREVAAALPLTHGPVHEALAHTLRGTGITAGPPGIELRASPRLGPGVFGVRRPVLVWPATASAHLTEIESAAVLAHEVAHIRRRDNLTAAVHRLVEALFWFHPLVWWLGTRLERERELACDEAALDRGADPVVYAEGLLKSCRLALEAALPLATAAAGADLRHRVQRILRERPAPPPSRLQTAWLAMLALATLSAPIAATALAPPSGLGLGGIVFQAPRLLTAWAPSIDTRTIADARFADVWFGDAEGAPRGLRAMAGGRVTGNAINALDLLRLAYFADMRRPALQLEGAPDWIRTEYFAFSARAGHEIVNDGDGEPRELVAMLRRLLAERFALRLRIDRRELPYYALVDAGATDGPAPRLRPTTSRCWRPGDHPPPAFPIHPSRFCRAALFTGGPVESASTRWLASMLTARWPTEAIVRDETGLAGLYDFSFPSPDELASPEAVERRLGLRLEPRVGPVTVYVIEHIERPALDPDRRPQP